VSLAVVRLPRESVVNDVWKKPGRHAKAGTAKVPVGSTNGWFFSLDVVE